MRKLIVLALMCLALLPTMSYAQSTTSSDSLTQLMQWIETQQAEVGTGLTLNGTKTVVTWWDAISLGTKGLNVGSANSLDFIDLGPTMTAANGLPTQYGVAVPLHLGTAWDSIANYLPSSIASHLNLATLPNNLVISALFLYPTGQAIDKFTWMRDFQPAIAYKFGGS